MNKFLGFIADLLAFIACLFFLILLLSIEPFFGGGV